MVQGNRFKEIFFSRKYYPDTRGSIIITQKKKKHDDYTMFRVRIFFIFVVIKFQHSLCSISLIPRYLLSTIYFALEQIKPPPQYT